MISVDQFYAGTHVREMCSFTDPKLAKHAEHLARCENALAKLERRKGDGAKWARAQLKAATKALRARVDSYPHAQIASCRQELAQALADSDAADTERAEATTVDGILRAQAAQELAARRVASARKALQEATSAASAPLGPMPLELGWMQHCMSSDNRDLVRVAPELAKYDGSHINRAAERAYACRTTEPDAMVFAIAFERDAIANAPERFWAELAFALRFDHFARVQKIPHTPIAVTAVVADIEAARAELEAAEGAA